MMLFMSLGMFFGVPLVESTKSSKKLYFISKNLQENLKFKKK